MMNSNYLERKKIILTHLKQSQTANVHQICQLTGASPATIRRDFIQMEREGLLTRNHGSVQLTGCSVLPANTSDDFADPVDCEKAKIALHAASLIENNDCIFIGAGRTCSLLASYIKSSKYVTVVTTSITAALELVNSPNISTTLLGGDIFAGNNFVETVCTDRELDSWIGNLFFDKVFITVDGVHFDGGYSIRYRRQIPLYRHLLSCSSAFYTLIDSTKFHKHSFVPVFDMEQLKTIVTTDQVPQDFVEYYQLHNIQLITV